MRISLPIIALGIAAALAACSIDAVSFTPAGDPPGSEDCAAAGDEDGNGKADCADPACAAAPQCRLACGNGRVDAGEACDDGNGLDGDGCDSNCTATGCGNGVRSGAEACDDGNLVNGDGCDANCTVTGCGNGIVTGAEVCDDGNLVDGDGCDSNCKGTGSGAYEASADAMIRISTGTGDASTNYGAAQGLFTYGSSFGTTARSLLAFDLAAVPAGPPILAAHLHVRLVDQAGMDYSIGVHEVLGPWAETGVTWSAQPPFNPVAEATLPYQGYTWWRFDVTALVQRWVTAPSSNLGLVLVQSPESYPSGGEFARFDSREGASRPYLEVVVGI